MAPTNGGRDYLKKKEFDENYCTIMAAIF